MKRNSTQDGAPRSEGARPAPEDVAPREDRRASADAVEKRRAARRFNDLLLGGDRPGDGRTERRRRRLLDELAEGVAHRGRRALKPIDVLSRVEELLALGEPLSSIRRACPPPRPVEVTPELADGLRRLHRAYGFSADAYRFVGLDGRALREAGVLGGRGATEAAPARGVAGRAGGEAKPGLVRPARRGGGSAGARGKAAGASVGIGRAAARRGVA